MTGSKGQRPAARRTGIGEALTGVEPAYGALQAATWPFGHSAVERATGIEPATS